MIKPIGNRVLIERDEAEKKNGNILLIEKPSQKSQGTVIAVGNNVKEVVSGNKVIFNRVAPHPIEIEGKEYLLVKEDELLAVF